MRSVAATGSEPGPEGGPARPAGPDAGPPQEVDDRRLWELATAEPAAFGILFERHAPRVFAYCARATADLGLAEDLTSAVFLQAWAHRSQVRLTTDSALPWLLGVAVNVVRNSRRSMRRYDAALARLPAAASIADHADRVVERVDAQHQLARAADAIAGLSGNERDVVRLVWWSGLSYVEAAVALDIPVGTVRSRLSRARARLRADLTDRPHSPALTRTTQETR